MSCQILYGIINVLIGVIMGALLAYLFGIRLQQNREKRVAFANFYAAFVEMIYYLREESRTSPIETIPELVREHEEAEILFRPYLRKCNIKSFNTAWNEYYGACKKYYQYQMNKLTKDQRNYLLDKINKLLVVAGKN